MVTKLWQVDFVRIKVAIFIEKRCDDLLNSEVEWAS